MGQNVARHCHVDTCTRPASAARGFCWTHYRRWQKYGDPHMDRKKYLQTLSHKDCTSCETTKPVEDFYTTDKNLIGRRATCKACDTKRARKYALKRTFGISLQDWDALYRAQGGGCAICGVPCEPDGRRLSVDHDHDTGQIRGLLCSGCNTGIGLLREDPDVLLAAIHYLDRWQHDRSRQGSLRFT